jgi:DNA-binding transcriptional LysR family regulator
MAEIEPSWDYYRTFLAVLNEGSLSGAARLLGLTQPTVGRHIDALEHAIGFQLFTRSQHGLSAMPAALELRPYAETLSSTAASLLRTASAQGGAVRGSVRITASEVVGVEVLPPILADLRRQWPELEIELVLSNAVEDLLRRDADIAVRMVEPVQDALVVKWIGTIALGFHAHRRYLERHGIPATAKDLLTHSLIGFDRDAPAARSMLRDKIPMLEQAHFAFRADSHLAQLAAIRAGFGIGVCQIGLAARDPDLVRLFPDAFELKLGTWLAIHENLRSTSRCRATFDALADGLARYVDR